MAAKKQKQQPTVEWVDISLSVEESAAMKKLYGDGDKLSADVERIQDDGYKLTLTSDSYNKCSACYVIPKHEDMVNYGKILTARGSDTWKAIRGALFRHYVLFQGDAWTNHEKQTVDVD